MRRFFDIPLPDEATDSPAPLQEMLECFQFLKPKPASHALIHIGDGNDGSYLVPDDLKGIAACFSPGVNNFKNFEDILTDRFSIPCHMCDYSSDEEKFQTPLRPGRQTFVKKWLDIADSDDAMTLDSWVAEQAPTGDLLLQMDIEGAEYRNLLAVSDRTLSRFRIIVLELHALPEMRDAATLRRVILPVLRRLADHFVTVHAHPNNAGSVVPIPGTATSMPQLLELTLIRKDRIGETRIPPSLPHPLDIGRNVRKQPPLFLDETWLDGPRPLESKVKMLEVQLEAVLTNDLPSQRGSFSAAFDLLTDSMATLSRRDVPGRDEETLQEVALGRPFVLSSSHGDAPRSGILTSAAPFFFHTRAKPNQFIQIDLGTVHRIVRIAITNRTDARRDRARMLFARLSTDPQQNDALTFPLTSARDDAALTLVTDLPVTPARYVRICSPADTALHFSEVRILAEA